MVNALNGRQNTSTDYYFVRIPQALQADYFADAKIGGGFTLVGRYVSNLSYKTVGGQTLSMPVFEALYWRSW